MFRGLPGSGGCAEGTVRILKSISEAAEVQRGDVLVVRDASPSWTPLFATVAAIVTDNGGTMSHCAVVAREFGLPAVVGTGGATLHLESGWRIRVDGDSGTVRVLKSEP